MPEPREVMNARQLSEYLSFSYANLRQILFRDEDSLPPYVVIGGYRRWYLATVQEWLRKKTALDSNSKKSTRIAKEA